MTETQSCPRRLEEMGPWEHKENLDTWRDAHQPENPGPVCSFCGSLNPETFLELISQGWVVGGTTKNYKAYLDEVLTLEERIAVPGQPLPPIACGRAKFYFQHLDEAQQRHFVDLYNTSIMRLGRPGYFEVLPFFMKVGQSEDS